MEGGGEILDSEKPHFTRKQIKDHWRLGSTVRPGLRRSSLGCTDTQHSRQPACGAVVRGAAII